MDEKKYNAVVNGRVRMCVVFCSVTDVESVRRELIKLSEGENLATMKDIDKVR